ncbi:hypothetical protein N657DRAFT_542883, partial [Parathielavia appendiculata]
MKRSREPEEIPPEDTAAVGPNTMTAVAGHRNGNGNGLLTHSSNGAGDGLPPAAKIPELDLSDNGNGRDIKMRCSLPPHKEPVLFSSYDEYETHYSDQHTNRCVECRKNFPSAHFLDLHIEETHDSFAQLRREQGERTYSCFVEGCEKKCSTPQKRKMHLIDKHMYPKNFFFAITRDGIDGRQSLLVEGRARRRRSSAATAPGPGSSQNRGQESGVTKQPSEPTDACDAQDPGQISPKQQPDQEMEDLSSAMSSLRFVPMSVRFGRGKKAGFAK